MEDRVELVEQLQQEEQELQDKEMQVEDHQDLLQYQAEEVVQERLEETVLDLFHQELQEPEAQD